MKRNKPTNYPVACIIFLCFIFLPALSVQAQKIIKIEGKYGLIDDAQNLYPVYDFDSIYTSDAYSIKYFFFVKKGKKQLVKQQDLKQVNWKEMKFDYDEIYDATYFNHRITFIFSQEGKYGAMDSGGDITVLPIYDSIYHPKHGGVTIIESQGKFTLVTAKDIVGVNQPFDFKYDQIYDQDDYRNMVYFRKGEKYGFYYKFKDDTKIETEAVYDSLIKKGTLFFYTMQDDRLIYFYSASELEYENIILNLTLRKKTTLINLDNWKQINLSRKDNCQEDVMLIYPHILIGIKNKDSIGCFNLTDGKEEAIFKSPDTKYSLMVTNQAGIGVFSHDTRICMIKSRTRINDYLFLEKIYNKDLSEVVAVKLSEEKTLYVDSYKTDRSYLRVSTIETATLSDSLIYTYKTNGYFKWGTSNYSSKKPDNPNGNIFKRINDWSPSSGGQGGTWRDIFWIGGK